MYIAISFILFMLLFLFPFLPGIIELFRKEDAEPLFISMDYMRNPRYFGKAFKKLLHRATAGFTLSPGMRDVKLSKDEKVELSHSISISQGREVNHMLYVIGKFTSGSHARFAKEVYVTDNAIIGSNNIFQAFAGDMDITIDRGTQFLRWLDAEGDVRIGEGCNLGINASSGGKLIVGRECLFRRLFGMPIFMGQNCNAEEDNKERPLSFPESLPLPSSFIRKKDSFIPPETIFNGNIVFTRDVLIGSGTVVKGDVKCYGKIMLQENVTIEGNIFADGDIVVGQNTNIWGHVFSQMSVYISEKTVISCPDKIKSVIGKKSISIEQGAIIYGFVTTEGEGRTI